jgi:hypothetical protein
MPPRGHPTRRELISARDLDELAQSFAEAEKQHDLLRPVTPSRSEGRPLGCADRRITLRDGGSRRTRAEQSATKASSLSPAAAICAACSAELAAFVMAEPSLRALTAASCQRIWAN